MDSNPNLKESQDLSQNSTVGGEVNPDSIYQPQLSESGSFVPESQVGIDSPELLSVKEETNGNKLDQQAGLNQNVNPPTEGGGGVENPSSLQSSLPNNKKRFPLFPVLIGVFAILVILVGAIFVFSSRFIGKNNQPKKIVWWNLWEDDAIVRSLIQEYETKNPNVKIEYVKQSPQDYRERLVNYLIKGDGPDIFVFHNTWASLLDRELDRVPTTFLNSADFARDYYYVISSDLTVGSGLVGVPLGYDTLTLFINEDLFREANLDPPTTWVELRDRAKALTKVENGKIVQAGVALGRTENVDHWQEIVGLMLFQNNVDFSNPEPDLVENALSFFTIFSKVDKVWDETLPTSTAAFAGGKLAMYFGPSWRYFNIKEANPSLNFRTIPVPQVPKENPEEPDVSYATYWVQGVWSKSSNKDLAWDFLKFISSRESLEKMYKQASLYRGFGEPYPRVDMGNMLLEDPVVGSVVKMAPYARSWYLASRTFDGPTGINSQIGKYFEDAINALNNNQSAEKSVETLILGIKQVLSQYGLSK